MTCADYADDLALLVNIPVKVESLLHRKQRVVTFKCVLNMELFLFKTTEIGIQFYIPR